MTFVRESAARRSIAWIFVGKCFFFLPSFRMPLLDDDEWADLIRGVLHKLTFFFLMNRRFWGFEKRRIGFRGAPDPGECGRKVPKGVKVINNPGDPPLNSPNPIRQLNQLPNPIIPYDNSPIVTQTHTPPAPSKRLELEIKSKPKFTMCKNNTCTHRVIFSKHFILAILYFILILIYSFNWSFTNGETSAPSGMEWKKKIYCVWPWHVLSSSDESNNNNRDNNDKDTNAHRFELIRWWYRSRGKPVSRPSEVNRVTDIR